MSSIMLPTILALLALNACALHSTKKATSLHGGEMTIKPGDCFKKSFIRRHSHALTQFGQDMQKKAGNPGAGLGKVEPFDKIFKDGFMQVACINDYMFAHGDKFGAHKAAYEIGVSSNVSIVHYAAVVAKEDQEPMTPTVCFDFCRTVEDMGYFGIMNGRDCYCEPYYKAMAGDSSQCTASCPGNVNMMCGGKAKSAIYEMHACNDGPLVLAAATVLAETIMMKLDDLVPRCEAAAEGKNKLAGEFQSKFSAAGDPKASDLMQTAKVSAGKLIHQAEAAARLSKLLKEPIAEASSMIGLDMQAFDSAPPVEDKSGGMDEILTDFIDVEKSNFNNFDVAKKADLLVAEMTKLIKPAEEAWKALQERFLLSEPMANGAFFVQEGPCTVDDQGCVMSPTTFHNDYYNNEYCHIEVQGELKLTVEEFSTEGGFDFLTVNGNRYSGSGSPVSGDTLGRDDQTLQDVKNVGHQIIWETDGSVVRSGWKLCGEQLEKTESGKSDQASEAERGLQYYPVMYFVDKEFVDVPMTCTGKVFGQPIYYKTYHLCAAACDANVHDCVGFSYFPTAPEKPNLCFLFSSFTSGQFYTGCESDQKQQSEFLQKHNTTKQDQPLDEEPTHPVCVAKLSKFVGTTLKPDASGKCKQCMKELVNAKRCWE